MAHVSQERYSSLVDVKLRNTLVTRDNIIFNNRYEGDPKAGKVKVPVRDTEVEVRLTTSRQVQLFLRVQLLILTFSIVNYLWTDNHLSCMIVIIRIWIGKFWKLSEIKSVNARFLSFSCSIYADFEIFFWNVNILKVKKLLNNRKNIVYNKKKWCCFW